MSIADIINNFIVNWSNKNELYLKIGTATSINETDYTFTFTPLDETSKVEDVRMKTIVDNSLESFIIIPEENSMVVVAFHSKNVAQCINVKQSSKIIVNSSSYVQNNENKELNVSNEYTINCDDVKVNTESWVYNGGSFGGLIKISILEQKLNDLVSELNSMKDQLNTHIHPGVTTGAGVSGQSSTSIGDFTSFDKGDFENDKIKH